ncbi:spore germination protein [Clostridium sp. DL1XJH146]
MGRNTFLWIKDEMKGSFDFKWRLIKNKQGYIYIMYIDDLCDAKFISEYVVAPLSNNYEISDVDLIKTGIVSSSYVKEVVDRDELINHVLSGDVVIIFDFSDRNLICEAKGYVRRSINTPLTEAVLKGPREGFNELIVDNVSLIRRKVKNRNLKFESMSVGTNSNTSVALVYIDHLTDEKLISYIRDKINSLDINFILDINYIEEILREKKTAFNTIGYSEKPDVIASKIMEGKVAVIVDGTPSVLIAPYFFLEHFQTPDDYYSNIVISTISRIERWIAFLLATLVPGLYVALTTHHFSLIPTVFVFGLASSRTGVPFPTIVELILMLSFFGLLREAGIRLPQPTGQALSIVGALILGESAVGAGLASQSTIVVVSVASIATFLIPNLYVPASLWSLIIVVLGSLIGMPGVYFGIFLLITHLSKLETCGYKYLYPLGTVKKLKLGDVFVRKFLVDISKPDSIKKDDIQ